MELTGRQEMILEIVKKEGPITGEQIAERLSLTRATLRPDLAILTMAGFLEARPRVGYFYSGKTSDRLIAEKMERIAVGEVNSVPVVVRENCSVYDAIVTMFIEDVGTLFVVNEEGCLAGVVSRKDFLKATLGGKDIQQLPVGVVMTRMPNIITVKPSDSILDAAKKIITHEVDALPVVRRIEGKEEPEQFKVLGRLSKTNITRIFVELGEGR